jgi:hypothetical protein
MIYPVRIKDGEYRPFPLKKGDIVVCIAESFEQFTQGKHYTVMSDLISSTLLSITSDLRNQPLPAYFAPSGYYFLPLHIYRELKLKEILDEG